MHRPLWFLLVKPVVFLSVLAASATGPTMPALAPGLEIRSADSTPTSEPQTLADLYQIRDRLQADPAPVAPVMLATPLAVGRGVPAEADSWWAINHRIHHEEIAQRVWQRASKAAAAASALGDPITLPEETVATAYTRWYQALEALAQVPPHSLAATQAADQRSYIENNLAIAAYRYDTVRSGFLAALAEQTGEPDRVRITVCNLQRECRRWLGHQPPASPASLIKVPVAVALMAKLHQEGIDGYTPLWVNPSNWTEDAGRIGVRAEYAIIEIMADMLSASGNVATNQLIDYLGWDGVNQHLRDRGYTATRITSKLVGERTYPANPGAAPNQITTDELTDMMVGIYNQEHPGDDLIQAALSQQRDVILGKTATRPPMIWLGEKTGRNSKLLGSTTALLIGGKPYIITVTLDYSANEAALRALIEGVIQHLLTHNGFENAIESQPPLVPRPKTFLP